ncbi:MAG: DegT/DnrJ/EryC1/StrS family aminotransferase [Kineosporiaceae bacterium]|nr:DegT/DnrJ/EryC1/StrS family aminotransferase [Aeromicrobium sp.]
MSTTISKTAVDTSNFRSPSFYYRSAREGMRDFLTEADIERRGDVLLPAFIGWSSREGSGVFDPVRECGFGAEFYDLGATLAADVSSIESKLSAGSVAVVVVIHYFGRTDPSIAAIRRLCDQHGAILIEDLAHGFFTSFQGGDAGSQGHVRLYSLHKMFPLNSGGMAVYESDQLVSGQTSTAPEMAERVLSYNWQAIARKRRAVFLTIASRLAALPEKDQLFEMMWSQLDEVDVPQTLPVRILGGNRDAIYEALNAQGYGMVSLYHTLIREIGESDQFASMNELSRRIINFPVHQDVDLEAIKGLVDAFQACLHSVAV